MDPDKYDKEFMEKVIEIDCEYGDKEYQCYIHNKNVHDAFCTY